MRRTDLTATTRFTTMDVTDFYAMISQEASVLALAKMMERFGLEKIEAVDKDNFSNVYLYFFRCQYVALHFGVKCL
jgi:lysophospholipid acyltransferase (LPLAT)-like uncharacterized protein